MGRPNKTKTCIPHPVDRIAQINCLVETLLEEFRFCHIIFHLLVYCGHQLHLELGNWICTLYLRKRGFHAVGGNSSALMISSGRDGNYHPCLWSLEAGPRSSYIWDNHSHQGRKLCSLWSDLLQSKTGDSVAHFEVMLYRLKSALEKYQQVIDYQCSKCTQCNGFEPFY